MIGDLKIDKEYPNLSKYWKDISYCCRCKCCIQSYNPEGKGTEGTGTGRGIYLVCPLFNVTGFDALSGFGRMSVSKSLLEGRAELSPSMVEWIYSCALCGNCKYVCPTNLETPLKRDDSGDIVPGLDITGVVEALRADCFLKGLGPLPHQKAAIKSIEYYDNPWQQPRSGRTRWAKDLKIKDLSKEGVDGDILYYVGCTYAYSPGIQKILKNTAKILKTADCDFGILGAKEKCCGSISKRLGDFEQFEKLASENVKAINDLGVSTVITSCAGCYRTLKNEHTEIEDSDYEVYHVVEYLNKLIKEEKLDLKNPVNSKVTYHDPCHLGRYGGVYDAPRKVLEAIPGLELNEMLRKKRYSFCCGGGGGLKFGFSEVALEMAKERLCDPNIKYLSLDAVVTACPWCEINISDAVKSYGLGMEVFDIVELVAKSIGD